MLKFNNLGRALLFLLMIAFSNGVIAQGSGIGGSYNADDLGRMYDDIMEASSSLPKTTTSRPSGGTYTDTPPSPTTYEFKGKIYSTYKAYRAACEADIKARTFGSTTFDTIEEAERWRQAYREGRIFNYRIYPTKAAADAAWNAAWSRELERQREEERRREEERQREIARFEQNKQEIYNKSNRPRPEYVKMEVKTPRPEYAKMEAKGLKSSTGNSGVNFGNAKNGYEVMQALGASRNINFSNYMTVDEWNKDVRTMTYSDMLKWNQKYNRFMNDLYGSDPTIEVIKNFQEELKTELINGGIEAGKAYLTISAAVATSGLSLTPEAVLLVKTATGLLASGGGEIAKQYNEGKSFAKGTMDWGKLKTAASSGIISGAIGGTPTKVPAGKTVNSAVSLGKTVAGAYMQGKSKEEIIKDGAKNVVTSSLTAR